MGWFAKQKLADHPKFYHKSHFQWQFRIHFCFLSSPCHNSIKNSKVCKLQFYEWNVFLFYIFYILPTYVVYKQTYKTFLYVQFVFFFKIKKVCTLLWLKKITLSSPPGEIEITFWDLLVVYVLLKHKSICKRVQIYFLKLETFRYF